MSSVILAGGRSARLGRDKASLLIAGKRLLQQIIDKMSQLDEEIILVLAQGQLDPKLNSPQTVKTTTDLYYGKGPLVGIYSGLKASSGDYSLVVACDMPFLCVDLLRYMIGLAKGFDIVIPRIGGHVEPLHALYSKDCLSHIEDMMKEGGILNPTRLLDRVKVRYVEENEIESFDPERLSFFNVNTPSELQKAEQIMFRAGSKR
jgi:molybdopterin-guanine dinucleotide biosynthesis protein A